ncbi:MAG: ABC transporter permease [Verrucomicrobia bacterium]|nr:ABC transporter permease [Verrucomicrobiota bacterium]
MRVLPIVMRELSVQARRKSTYWIRMLASSIAGFLMVWLMLVVAAPLPFMTQGKALFSVLAVFAFVYCLLVGATVTADSLSAEKRDGTLGLLFLTPLKGYDVILGKLVSCSVHAVFGLLAVVPMMALALLLGGLTLAEILRTALVLGNTLFLSLAVGIFVSTISRNERKALFASILGVLLVAVGPYEIEVYWESLPGRMPGAAPFDSQFLAISPIRAFLLSRESLMASFRTVEFYGSVAQTHALAWLFVGLASAMVSRVCQDRTSERRDIGWSAWWRGRVLGGRSQRDRFRARLLDLNPCLWLCFRHPYKAWLPWVLVVPLALIGVWIFVGFPIAFYESALLLVMVVHLLLKVWVTAETSNRWVEDRRDQALELVLCAPIGTREILRGQGMALWRQFAWPVGLTLALTFLAWCAMARTAALGSQSGRIWLLIGIAALVPDLMALRWVAAWNGLTARGLNRAVLFSLTRVLLLRWPVYLALSAMTTAGAWLGMGEGSWLSHPLVWLGLALVVDLALGLQARTRFLNHFRTLAADPSAPTASSAVVLSGAGANRKRIAGPSVSEKADVPVRSKSPGFSKRWALGVAVVFLIIAAGFWLRRTLLERRVTARMEELRSAGLPTTWDELDRMRPTVPESKNTALLLERAVSELINPGTLPMSVQRELPSYRASNPPRTEPLPSVMLGAIQTALESNRAALALLSEPGVLGVGRYAMDGLVMRGMSVYGGSQSDQQLQGTHWGGLLFYWQSLALGETGDVEGAMEAVRRLFALGRSLENESVWFFHGRRSRCYELGLAALERLMGRAPLPERDLEKLQNDLERVGREGVLPRLIAGLRCLVKQGTRPRMNQGMPPGTGRALEEFRVQLVFQINDWTGRRANAELELLERLDRFAQIVTIPYPERIQSASRLAGFRVRGMPVNGGFGVLDQARQAIVLEALLEARCRVMITSIAIERYRGGHSDALPLQLADLTPGYLVGVPADPFDGRSVRYRRTGSGYCVYSVGQDGADDGGTEPKARRSMRYPGAGEDLTVIVER